MSILVTGATGFIGSHLCRELVTREYEVSALTHSGRTDNIQLLLTHSNFHLYTGDIQDTVMMQDIMQENRVETVFHLAARLPDEKDIENPIPCFNTNVMGTLSLLNSAASNGVNTFIYVSTMSVYSEPPEYLPVDESHPTKPSTIYGAAKLAGEFCCRPYSSNMRTIVVRYGGIYGKYCRESDAVPTFMRQALRNEPITIFGDGKQSSDFVHVDEALEGTLQVWEKGESGIYNIGSGEETSIEELAGIIKRITNTKSKIISKGNETERPFRFVLNINKARKLSGYSPRPLEEGLRRYAEEIGHQA
jgi:UDP-glucose 4-epimerase